MDRKFLGLAALTSAALASVCCIGPLVLTGLGLGSLGLAAGLTKYRPAFLALTGRVLAVAFYLAYRKRSVACADGSCERRSGGRAMQAGVWTTAVLAAAETFSLKVAGMTCEACAAAIEDSVEKVPGVLSADIDFPGERASVVSDGKAEPGAMIRAVEAAGYKAELLNEGGHE